MSSFYLNLEATPGADIEWCCQEAIKISKQLDIAVNFKFNGVVVGARPYDVAEKIVRAYHKALNSDHSFKVACGND